MRTKLSNYRRLFLCISFLGLFIVIHIGFNRSTSNLKYIDYQKTNISRQEINNSLCFKWDSTNHKQSNRENCLLQKNILSTIWTHDGTGLMKYIQWIVTRKVGNVKIFRLNPNCQIIEGKHFLSNSKTDKYLQVFLLSLSTNFDKDSSCSKDLRSMIKSNEQHNTQIYFKRKSIKATTAYQYLDLIKFKENFTLDWNITFNQTVEKGNYTTEYIIDYFKTIQNTKSIIINSEDMIHSTLIDTEKMLTDFLLLLQFDISTQIVKDIIEHDSYQFTDDATWWDQSQTIEHIISNSIPLPPSTLTYSNDFYHLHGNHSFTKYLFDSRKCYRDGIFSQMPHERISNRSSTDIPERCSMKQFDCAFSDIYSFNDRQQLYQSYEHHNYFNQNPIKCGFAIRSILDKVRNLYGRNHTCQTVVATCITNCYDPLPNIEADIPPDICFVALLDTKTFNAIKDRYAGTQWNLLDLGEIGSLFRVPPKVTESLKILGHRMFPMAKWFIWLDGKAYIINIKEILTIARTSVVGLHHSDYSRTSENEVNLTITRVKVGEDENSTRLRITLEEINLQEAEYRRDGFYSRSSALGLPLFDIAIFTYRNNHPCGYRYLCGWHNEVNYFSYRGQLSVYYSAERLNISDYLTYIPRRFYHTMAHNAVC